MKEKIFQFFKSNPAIFITVLSAYGYYCAYCFEMGYCTYYHIPLIYINIEIVNIIGFTFATLGILLFVAFHLRGIIYDRNPLSDGKIYPRRTIVQFNVVAFALLFFLGMTIELPVLVHYICYAIILVINIILFTYFRRLQKKALSLTMEIHSANPTLSVEEVTKQVVDKLVKKTNTPNQKSMTLIEEFLNYTVGIVMFFPLLIFFMGYGNASQQKLFSILSDHSPMAVVRKYGDEIICKNYDKKTNKLGDSILVFKLDNSTKLSFTIKPVKH